MMMWDGKKSVAFKIFYDAIAIVEEKKFGRRKNSFAVVERRSVKCDAAR